MLNETVPSILDDVGSWQYTILRYDQEEGEFGWYMYSDDDYDSAIARAKTSAAISGLSWDMLGIRDNETRDIVAIILKFTPPGLPFPFVHVFEYLGPKRESDFNV